MKIVLYQPQIPQNAGNIARTCAVTDSSLILVRPLGFSTASRHLKRAGLDYWSHVSVEEIDDLAAMLTSCSAPFFFFSSKATRLYTDVCYPPDSMLIFGSETEGLPSLFWERWPQQFVHIPMKEGTRCLNLACSAAIGLYEALRQNHFSFLPNKLSANESTALIKNELVRGK